MDLASPISSVIPSLDGAVLAVLAGTTGPLSLTTVHRLAGRGSLSGVRRVLLRLGGTGLVREVPGGYVLNREHVAAPAVQQLAQLWQVLLDRIRHAVDAWPEQPVLVGLFGSAGRRDGDEDSDIDLLVVSDSVAMVDQVAELAQQVEWWSGNAVHVVTLTSKDLERLYDRKDPLLSEWARDLVVLRGRSLEGRT